MHTLIYIPAIAGLSPVKSIRNQLRQRLLRNRL